MWHPENEAQACSDLAAFIEWLRATTGDDTLSPDALRRWQSTDPAAFERALAAFGVTAEALFRPPS